MLINVCFYMNTLHSRAILENSGIITYSERLNLRYEKADKRCGISGFILYNNRRDRSSHLRPVYGAIPLGPNLVIRVTLGILHSITIFDPWGIVSNTGPR